MRRTIFPNIRKYIDNILIHILVFTGVARGCGWQHLVVFVNLGTFYLIGMPVAALLAFKFELHAKVILYFILSVHATYILFRHRIEYCIYTKCVGAGVMDRLNKWSCCTNDWASASYKVHKMDKNGALPAFIFQHC